MNDNFNMDSTDFVPFSDVSVADETNVTEKEDTARKAVSATDSLTVADTPVSRLKNFIGKYWVAITILIISMVFMCFGLKSNAAEINYSIDNVMNNQFANYPYRILAKCGEDYMVFYSDNKIFYTGSTRYACNSGTGTCGYTAMKIENNELVSDSSGNSGTFDLSTGRIDINIFGYSEVIWASQNVPVGSLANGSYVTTGLHFDTSNNAVYIPDTSDETENGTTDNATECKFTDENIVESINVFNKDLVAKMDILIMLLIVMIAIKMFSPLANNHKRGLEKKEK